MNRTTIYTLVLVHILFAIEATRRAKQKMLNKLNSDSLPDKWMPLVVRMNRASYKEREVMIQSMLFGIFLMNFLFFGYILRILFMIFHIIKPAKRQPND